MAYETLGRRKESIEIMKAIRNKEVELAESLTKIHIENSKKAYIKNSEQLKANRSKKGKTDCIKQVQSVLPFRLLL